MRDKIANMKTFLNRETPQKYAAVFAAILVLCLLLEVFVFNFKWINSLFDKELDISPEIVSGARMSGGDIIISDDEAVLSYKNPDRELKYLYFNPDGDDENTAVINAAANDEGNTVNMLVTPDRAVSTGVKRSQYIRLHFSGVVSKLNITIKDFKNKKISADDIALNVRVPLMFSWLRWIILSLILMALYALRPSSSLYRYKTDLKSRRQRIAVIIFLVLEAAVFFNMINWNTGMRDTYKTYEHHKQYYELVDAIKNGRVDLGEAEDAVKNLNNPYDMGERNSKNVKFKWDHAYYNGKYYVYFGAAPAVLLYLPYNLLTGGDLPNYIAVYIFGVMIMIGILLLLWEIIKKWYKNTPFVLYLLLSAVFGAASILGYAVFKPDLYLVPIASAVMFALFGLAFWVSAERADDGGEIKLSSWRLTLGSLCVAVIAGCRPQLLLIVAIGIMLFWNAAFKERTLFSKKGIKPTLAVCLPFVAVAAVVMCYNYARFGSPFDFGANYNLTTNDMTVRGFVFGRIGLGIFSYFLQPFKVDAVFPFLKDFQVAKTYMGLTLTESMTGGAFWLVPLMLFGLVGAFKKSVFHDRRAYRLVYFSMMIALITAVLDAEMSGLLPRYFTDFVWAGCLASCVTIFAMYDASKRKERKRLIAAVTALSVMTIVIVFLSIFINNLDAVSSSNPVLYYTVRHLIAFWM